MAYAPKPSFTKEDSQPIVIQNKMPKQGEPDVTGTIPGGGGAGSTFRLVTSPGTSTTPTTSSSTSGNPYPTGYTSGMPQGLDTVSGPGASYNPGTGSGSGGSYTTPNGSRVTRSGTSGQFPGLISDTDPIPYGAIPTGYALGAGGTPIQYGTDSASQSPSSTAGASRVPSFSGIRPPQVNTNVENSVSGPVINPTLPIPGGAPTSSSGGAGGIYNQPGGGWSGFGQSGGTGGVHPVTGQGSAATQRLLGYLGQGQAPSSSYPTWEPPPGWTPNTPPWNGGGGGWQTGGQSGSPYMGGPAGGENAMYNKGGGGNTYPPGTDPPQTTPPNPTWTPPGERPPIGQGVGSPYGTANPNLDRFRAWHYGGSNPWYNEPGRGPAAPTWLGGSYNPWTGQQGGGGSTPPTGGGGQPPWIPSDPQTPGGGSDLRNYPPSRPPGGTRYTTGQQGMEASGVASNGPGGGPYLGPPGGQQNYPPFPQFDPANPPSPQQLLKIVQDWYAQFLASGGGGRDGRYPPGTLPQNPIQNPTWGSPWPGWNRGDDLRSYPPSRPPGGTR